VACTTVEGAEAIQTVKTSMQLRKSSLMPHLFGQWQARRTRGKLLSCLLCFGAWLPAKAQTPEISPSGLVNLVTGRSMSSVPVVARGSLVSIHGNGFSSTWVSNGSVPVPTQLPGTETQVLFGDVAAPLFFVSPTQINALVPFELPDTRSVDLVIRNGNGASAPLKVILLTQDPEISSVVRLGSQVDTSNPIIPGDIISIYATGLAGC
jgi:hypothetical protein